MRVLSEVETLEHAIKGGSLARFGDGELRLAVGGSAVSQGYNNRLRDELRAILTTPGKELACIPNPATPKKQWPRYHAGAYAALYKRDTYGSTFISRPESAPWINTRNYWDRVKDIWRDRHVTLVRGDDRSLRPDQLAEASSLYEVRGPSTNAYVAVDWIEEQIGRPAGPILMCLGATATVLGRRLANKGLWAVDLGHIGMFMRRADPFYWPEDRFISAEYKRLNQQLHERPGGYGGSGYKHLEAVVAFIAELKATSLLDYGAGEGTLHRALRSTKLKLNVREYDPAVFPVHLPPEPADLVVCTDVLEHVEPEKLKAVLAHIALLAHYGVYLHVATRPSNKTLADGRNTHLIVQPAAWWLERLNDARFRVVRYEDNPGHSLTAWVIHK